MAVEASEQAQYVFRAATLSTHDLLVASIDGTEAISQLFHYRLLLTSRDRDIKSAEVVGQAGVITILMNQNEPEPGHPENTAIARYVNGIVSRFEHQMDGSGHSVYSVELVPFVWLLNFRQNSRIFQQMNTKEIVSQVLTDAGLTTDMFKWALKDEAVYKKREYCVQYRESEWNFVSRLLEEEGIFYHFEHAEEGHVLIMGDHPEVHVPIYGRHKLPYRPPSGQVALEHVHHFRLAQEIRTGAVELRDYEFRTPGKGVQSKKEALLNKELEAYDYHSGYNIHDDTKSKEDDKDTKPEELMKRLTDSRLQESQSTLIHGRGSAVCRRFMVGRTFELEEFTRESTNQVYVITHMRVSGDQHQAGGEDTAGDRAAPRINYNVDFQCIPVIVPFRPPRMTPKPYSRGTQTAIVVGPGSEEIHTDIYGRIKVRFHWDREGDYNDKAGTWLRVNQLWSGGQYGHLFIPRIGQEVIVDFLEGDFDQPIVIGSVYNRDQMPPCTLPDEKTKSYVFRSNSSIGGGGANELSIEDKKDSEKIFMHAQKDHHIRVKHDRVMWVGNDLHETTCHEHREDVHGNHSRKIGGAEAISVGGDRGITVGGKVLEKYGDDQVKQVGGKWHVSATTEIVLESPTISLNGGGGFVLIDSSGVTIQGTQVKINSGGSKIPYSSKDPASPAKPIEPDDEKPGKDVDYSGTKEPPKPVPIPILPKQSWVKIKLQDAEGKPVPGMAYEVKDLKDRIIEGTLDVNGEAYVGGIEPGTCQIRFPQLDDDEWRDA